MRPAVTGDRHGCRRGPHSGVPLDAISDELAQFVSVVLADTEDIWRELFAPMGERYIDLSFYELLRSRFRAAGDDPSHLVPMHPCTGPQADSCCMACLNAPDCPTLVATASSSWGSVTALYREETKE